VAKAGSPPVSDQSGVTPIEGTYVATRKRILIVDDDGAIRALHRLILEGIGYEVREAHHGGSALAQIGASVPDLVMTDLMMPVLGGTQLIRCLRADSRTACVPILVVSGNPNAREIASKADAVLGKPLNRASLVAIVGSLLAESGSRPNEGPRAGG
jgi:CheY-like chemotaxis protein